MEKTEMMQRYEARTGLCSTRVLGDHWCNEEVHTENYVDDLEERLTELQAKAEAYDRLMSGRKKTLKEWANTTGKVFAVDRDGKVTWGDEMFPAKNDTWGFWFHSSIGSFGEFPRDVVDFNGDWTTSLTAPDNWEMVGEKG